MAGAVSPGPEVVDRLDQPGTEMVVPEPVDQDPGGQRVLGRDQPAGEPGAGVGQVGGELGLSLRDQDARWASADGLTFVLPKATPQDVDRRSLLEVIPGRRDRRGPWRHLVAESLDLVDQ